MQCPSLQGVLAASQLQGHVVALGARLCALVLLGMRVVGAPMMSPYEAYPMKRPHSAQLGENVAGLSQLVQQHDV